jgi:glycosyltransferase involved in cell wall biosynthesis
MSKPLVSVIIPTYNCGPYIADALDSVLTQDYSPMEVIAVDDGSTDDTREVLARYGDRVRVYSQANKGPAAARNLAVRESRGQYLAFLDGDDLWLPGKLSAQMACLAARPELKVVFGSWFVWRPTDAGVYEPLNVSESAPEEGIDETESGWIYSKLLFDSVIHIIAAVIHRSVYDTVSGFDESLRTGSDYDFWVRVSRHFEVTKLRRKVAVYRQNLTSVTHVARPENNPYRLLHRALTAVSPISRSCTATTTTGKAIRRLPPHRSLDRGVTTRSG